MPPSNLPAFSRGVIEFKSIKTTLFRENGKEIKHSKPKEVALADTSVYVEPVFGTVEVRAAEARVYLYKVRDK